MVIYIQRVLSRHRGQQLAGALGIAHVAEYEERVGREIGRQVSRHELGLGQKAQVPRDLVLLEVADALAHALERQTQRQPGAERVAVRLHVADHDERTAPPQFGGNFLGRRDARRLDHSLSSVWGCVAASRSVLASAMARSVERSSTKTSSGV